MATVKKPLVSKMAVGLVVGAATSMSISLLGAGLTAYLIESEKIGEGSIRTAAMVITILSASIGAWMAMAKVQKQRMQVCLLCGLAYYLLLISTTAMFFGGQYYGMGISALAVLGGCGTVAFLASRGSGKKGRKKMYR